ALRYSGPGELRLPRPLLLAEAAIEAVDEVGHRLQPLGDHAQPVLAEVLRLDAECLGERADDVVRRHGPVAVHEMVQVAGREIRPLGERTVGDSVLAHQALDCWTKRFLAVLPPPGHPLLLLARLGHVYTHLLARRAGLHVDLPV